MTSRLSYYVFKPVTAVELATAMYRAGHDRREVRRRLLLMARWTLKSCEYAAFTAEGHLGLSFPHGNKGRRLRPRRAPCHDGAELSGAAST